ncbi:hypothetical protein NESM_000745000 [Novymonas esmeraldas]|uniref:Piezo non-specific cation channel R-Ras-binding domain-containing protein n=1 Tax=Novymonas esmeraldas TaxID=1808958 RepID=A0AAW0EXM8_9TRYP
MASTSATAFSSPDVLLVVDDAPALLLSRRRAAAMHIGFCVIASVSVVGLRAPAWLLGALVYCCAHRSALVGQRLLPHRLWQVLLACLAASAVCNLAANALSTLLHGTPRVQLVLWGTLWPVWALLGVQQWDSADVVHTVASPALTTLALGAYLLLLHRILAKRILSRASGSGVARDASPLHRIPSHWAATVLAQCRLAASPLLALLSWVTAWAAQPSVLGFCLETLTFVFAATFLCVEWQLRRQPRRAVRRAQWAVRFLSHTFGAVVAAAFIGACAAQNSAFVAVAKVYGDWCRLLGVGPAALDTVEGVRCTLQIVGLVGVVLGATAVDRGMAASEAFMTDGDTAAAPPSSGSATTRLLDVREQRALEVLLAELPTRNAEEQRPRGRHSRAPQVVAILCLAALLAYSVYYPSLVSLAVWLIHLCGCAGGLVQHPTAPSPALRLALVCALAALCGAILVQYVAMTLAGNSRTAAWAPWPPARPASTMDGRAVAAQVAAEHLIALLCGVYISAVGVSGPDDGSTASDEDAAPAAPPPSMVHHREPPSTDAERPPAEPAPVSWLRRQLRDAAADRRRVCALFEVAVGRPPRTVELDAVCAAAQCHPSLSPAIRAGGLTPAEVSQYLTSGPVHTYAVILCMFVLGTSGVALDLLHASCLVLSLAVSVIGGNAVLYRRVRTVPPVWVAVAVGAHLGYSVLFGGSCQPSPSPSPSSVTVGECTDGVPVAWGDCVPYLYAQIVLLWCSRYRPRWLTEWTPIAQCLVFRCRWARVFRVTHQLAGVVVLAWIALLLPRSASITVLILLLFSIALLQRLRWHGLAYVWRRYLVVGYCGVVLLSMLTADFAPVLPWLWRVLGALGCPPGSEGRCAQDLGLPADSVAWLTPLSTPWWLVIVLATTTASPHPLPGSLLSSPDTETDAGATDAAPTAPSALRRGALEWWPQVAADGLAAVLLAALVHTALWRPSVLTALYLVAVGVGAFPCWTLSVGAVHVALQCTYQMWFAPAWLDTLALHGVSLAELIGLWRPTSPADSLAALPSTLSIAAAPLLIGGLQALQLQCAMLARWRSRNRVAGASAPARSWRRLRRTCATHLYVCVLCGLLSLSQTLALGWGVGALLLLVWSTAEVGDGSSLQRRGRRRCLLRLYEAATTALLGLAYALYWLHVKFASWRMLAAYPWLLGGGTGAGAAELGRMCWAAAAACALLRVSSAAPRDDQDARLSPTGGNSSFLLWLRRRGGHTAPLSSMTADGARDFFQEVEDVYGGGETPLASSGTVETMARIVRVVPLLACGSVAVGCAAPSPPCLISVALLLAGLGAAVMHARLQCSFWRWWRPAVAVYALLPLAALLVAIPPIRGEVLTLPRWVGLLVGLSADASHVDAGGLAFTGWHVVLFTLMWVQSCAYNSPDWGAALLRQQEDEGRLSERRHAALQQQLAMHATRSTEEAVRVDREVRAYLEALRTGDHLGSVSPAREERNTSTHWWEQLAAEAEEAARGSVPVSPTPMVPARGAEEVGEVDGADRLDGVPTPPPMSLPSPVSGAEGRGSTATQPPSLPYSPAQTLSSLWWRQRCSRWLQRLGNALSAYTYHPAEYRIRTTDTATVSSLRLLARRALLTAVLAALRRTPLMLFACTLVHALLTGCLWELVGLCYVVQVALGYHPHAPRLVYTAFGIFIGVGVLLKEAVEVWTTVTTVDPSITAVLSWTLLPRTVPSRHNGSGGNGAVWTYAPPSAAVLRYDTLWIDVLTIAVLVLHDRVCIIHGVYVEWRRQQPQELQQQQQPQPHQQQQQQHSVDDAEVWDAEGRETGAPATPRLSPPTMVKTTGATSPGTAPLVAATPPTPPAAPVSPAGLGSGGNRGGVRALLTDYYRNLVAVSGVGEDWYMFYTVADLVGLLVVAVLYSRIAGTDNVTLQDNVQNNLLPGPMAVLLCVNVLQLVLDRMLYVQRCMGLKALSNGVCAVVYCLLYLWWRNAVTVSARTAGNTYFALKVVALVLSVTQVCRGFPVHRRRDAFTTHPGSLVSYCCFMTYRALPFLWELRTLIDWTVLRTSLSLQEYLTLEDAYVYMYLCRERYLAKRHNKERLGDAVPPLLKLGFGVSRLALILLALLGPLLYYSTYNPSTAANRASQLSLQLSFFGAYEFFATTVHDDTATPEGWWTWLARTRPTLGSYGPTTVAAAGQTVQLVELTSCSSSLWMASPQAIRQVLAGLRAAASNTSSAYLLQSLEVSRSVSGGGTTAAAATLSLVDRWPIPQETAQDLVTILEREMSGRQVVTTSADQRTGGSGSGNGTVVAAASLPFFYSPFAFNRASRLDALPANPRFPHRNRHNCTLELNHDRDATLHTLVRYWCLHCTPLFPEGNVPSENVSDAAEWRCLTTGEGCDAFNYEDADGVGGAGDAARVPPAPARDAPVPFYVVVVSDAVVMGISLLKGIGIVAIYTTFVLTLGRLLRSLLANQVGTLLYSNMANPAVLENMVRCIGMAREYGDLRLEHGIYLELVDMLRSPDRLFRVTGPLRCMYVDAGHDDIFRLSHMRRRGSRRRASLEARDGATGDSEVPTTVTSAPR